MKNLPPRRTRAGAVLLRFALLLFLTFGFCANSAALNRIWDVTSEAVNWDGADWRDDDGNAAAWVNDGSVDAFINIVSSNANQRAHLQAISLNNLTITTPDEGEHSFIIWGLYEPSLTVNGNLAYNYRATGTYMRHSGLYICTLFENLEFKVSILGDLIATNERTSANNLTFGVNFNENTGDYAPLYSLDIAGNANLEGTRLWLATLSGQNAQISGRLTMDERSVLYLNANNVAGTEPRSQTLLVGGVSGGGVISTHTGDNAYEGILKIAKTRGGKLAGGTFTGSIKDAYNSANDGISGLGKVSVEMDYDGVLQVFSGANAFSGKVKVNAGTLLIDSLKAVEEVSLSGGKFGPARLGIKVKNLKVAGGNILFDMSNPNAAITVEDKISIDTDLENLFRFKNIQGSGKRLLIRDKTYGNALLALNGKTQTFTDEATNQSYSATFECSRTEGLSVTFANAPATQPPASVSSEFYISADCTDDGAEAGKTVTFYVYNNANPSATYTLSFNGNNVRSGSLSNTGETPNIISYTPQSAGHLFLNCGGVDSDKKDFGVVVSPQDISPVNSAPSDLSDFWEEAKAQVDAAPLDLKLSLHNETSTYTSYKFEAKIDDGEVGTSAGVKACGYLAIPKGEGKFPACATYFGAGSFDASEYEASRFAQMGVIGISVNPHPIPETASDEEKQAMRAKLSNYVTLGKDQTPYDSYFLGMFKRVYQSLRIIKSLDSWDGKNLAARGFSQGGAQTLAAAYLCKDVSVIAPVCPAMCDQGGRMINRRSGWPDWVNSSSDTKANENSRYFDPALMARSINARMLVGAGLVDNTCTPSAVTAMYNNYAGPKEIFYMQNTAHSNTQSDWVAMEIETILDSFKNPLIHSRYPLFESCENKVVAGYQGWFRTPGDGSGMNWFHLNMGNGDKSCNIDLWPYTDEYEITYDTGFKHADGSTAQVFSSYDESTIDTHFRWMKEYGIDAAFMQRFYGYIDQSNKDFPNYVSVLQKAYKAAQKYRVGFAVMYDLSGLPSDGGAELLIKDWKYLVDTLKFTESDDNGYVYHRGRPLVILWGTGISGRIVWSDESDVSRFLDFLKNDPKYGNCSVMFGTACGWRTGVGDAHYPEKEKAFYKKYADIISPWTPGRMSFRESDGKIIWPHGGTNPETHTSYTFDELVALDKKWCDENGIDLMPVAYPGFSWWNMKGKEYEMTPRRKGKYFWELANQAVKGGAKMIYCAMFDELDEGTAIFKVSDNPPVSDSCKFVAMEGLPEDHYLFLAGKFHDLFNLRRELPMPARIITKNSAAALGELVIYESDSPVAISPFAPNPETKCYVSINSGEFTECASEFLPISEAGDYEISYYTRQSALGEREGVVESARVRILPDLPAALDESSKETMLEVFSRENFNYEAWLSSSAYGAYRRKLNSSIEGSSDGSSVSIYSELGLSYKLQRSSDLKNWEDVSELEGTGETLEIQRQQGEENAFYRSIIVK